MRYNYKKGRKEPNRMDTTQRRKNDFTEGGIAKNILSLAIPLTVAQLTVVLYNVVDRAFIGHIEGIGRDAFTGIGLVMPVTYIITAFANLCGTGGAPLCSIARGRGDIQRARRIMGCAFSLLLLLGIAMMCALGINTLLVSVLPMYFVPLGRTSTITGLLNTCMHFASSVSSYAIAAMSAAWGWPPTVLGWAGVSLIGAVCTLAVRGRFYGFVRRLEPETKK